MERQPPYRSHVLDHLGRVAALVEELGLSDVLDPATPPHPDMRIVTAGHAVNAMGLNGLGLVHQHRDLGPHFCPNQPPARLIAPGIAPEPLPAEAWGRAFDPLEDEGGTERDRRMAATAAERRGLPPPVVPRESPSVHGDGRETRAEGPDEPGIPLPRGDRREPRSDLNPVRREVMVAPHAGSPVLMQPRRGKSRDATDFGHGIREPMAPRQTTDGPTALVADRALESADTLQTLADPRLQGATRVPATGSQAPAALAQADPPTLTPRMEGDGDQPWTSSDGGVAQRWAVIASEPRRPHAQRTVDQPWRQPRDQEGSAFTPRCRTAFAWKAEAPPARSPCAPGRQATCLDPRTGRPIPR